MSKMNRRYGDYEHILEDYLEVIEVKDVFRNYLDHILVFFLH